MPRSREELLRSSFSRQLILVLGDALGEEQSIPVVKRKFCAFVFFRLTFKVFPYNFLETIPMFFNRLKIAFILV